MNPLPATDPTLAVLYRRVSTADQADRGYGLDAQARALREYVAREALTVVGSFADPGVSGTKPLEQRPGLSAALDAVISAGAGVLVVARHDRLARETLQALLIERAFADAGCRILYAEGGNGDGDADVFTRQVLHAAAEQGKREVVRRLQAGRRAKAAADPRAYVGGRPPYGYEARGGELRPEPEQAAIVERIFRLCCEGKSIRSIAELLDAESAGGRRWHAAQVDRILNLERYKLGAPADRVVDPKLFNRASRARASRAKRPTERG